MDVVVHQAVGHQPRLELLRVMRQTPEVLPPIRVVPEDRFSLVAPNDHVVQPPSHLNPQRPRHLAIVPTYKTDPLQFAGTGVPVPRACRQPASLRARGQGRTLPAQGGFHETHRDRPARLRTYLDP